MTEATIALLVTLFLLLVSSAPIAVALGLTSFVYFYYFTTIPLTQVPERLFNSLNTFPLMAIPFFVLAANIMSRGGISKRLTDAGNALVGQFRGRTCDDSGAVVHVLRGHLGVEPGHRRGGRHPADPRHDRERATRSGSAPA